MYMHERGRLLWLLNKVIGLKIGDLNLSCNFGYWTSDEKNGFGSSRNSFKKKKKIIGQNLNNSLLNKWSKRL